MLFKFKVQGLKFKVLFATLLSLSCRCWCFHQQPSKLILQIVVFTFFISSYLSAQQLKVFPQEQFYTIQYEREHNTDNFKNLTTRPFIFSDSVSSLKYKTSKPLKNFNHKIFNHLLVQDLFSYQYKIFDVHINPVFYTTADYNASSLAKTKRYHYERGAQVYGHITNQFFFSTTFIESQSRFVNYFNSFVADTGIVPQMARVKNYKNKIADYEYSDAIISYKPNEYLDISVAHNHNFFGYGYRSLLLSDNAIPYTNLKFNAHFGKINYTWMLADLQNYRRGSVLGSAYEKKYIAIHYLDFWLLKRFEIGLFESVVWPKYDTTAYRGFELNYLNPLIFYHSVQNYLGSADNSLIGLNIHSFITIKIHYYLQFVIDDLDLGKSNGNGFYRDKFAFQLGTKIYNPFKIENLFIQLEYNQAQPYTYAHKLPAIAYTHMQQPLAHPLGANFKELIGIIGYDYKRFYTQAKLQFALVGIDTNNSHNGNNIFRTDYDIAGFPKSYNNKILQGIKTDLLNAEFKVGYLINPVNRTAVELLFIYRRQSNSLYTDDMVFISFGIRTNLFNRYYDF